MTTGTWRSLRAGRGDALAGMAVALVSLATVACTGARTGLEEPTVDRIAFTGLRSATDARGTLFFTRTDVAPGGRRQIFATPGANDDSWPAWSPDGRSLAFARWNGGEMGVFIVAMTLDGRPSPPRRVARTRNVNRLDTQISWGRTGLIAYHDAGAIWTVPAGPSPPSPVRRTPAGMTADHPSWSFDGRLVFVTRDTAGAPTLNLLARDLATITPLGVTGDEPSWSWDYDAIVFVRSNDIIYRDMRSDAERTVISNGRNPVFGPGSREIAFVRDGRIFVCDLSGANVRPVTDGPNDRQPTWRRHDLP